MLAYVFFHRPTAGVEVALYERRLSDFHVTLELTSASFRLQSLPFGDHGPGYEDWYLVPDWVEIGRLADVALAQRRRAKHDAVAALTAEGWGGIWALMRGPAQPPPGLRWIAKPAGVSYEEFMAARPEPAGVWQRQLVLGPAPEFAVTCPEMDGRMQIV